MRNLFLLLTWYYPTCPNSYIVFIYFSIGLSRKHFILETLHRPVVLLFDPVVHSIKNIHCSHASSYIRLKIEYAPSPHVGDWWWIRHHRWQSVGWFLQGFISATYWPERMLQEHRFVPHAYCYFPYKQNVGGSPQNRHSAELNATLGSIDLSGKWEAQCWSSIQWLEGEAKLIFRKLSHIHACQQGSGPQAGYHQKEIDKPVY